MATIATQNATKPTFQTNDGRERGDSHELDVIQTTSDPVPLPITTADQDVAPTVEHIRSKIRTIAIVAALYAVLFAGALNATIIGTALPTISAQLGSASGYSWVGGAYILATGAAVPIWAKLSDIFGRKPILLTATGGYFASSILCATSTSMRMLIASRALQGTAAGGTGQLVYITISDLFSARERTLYMGYTQILWTIAGGIGPVLGGAFAQTVGWQWCFWLNLPVSGFAFVLLALFLDVHNPKTKVMDGIKAIDWLGSVTVLGFVIMVLLGLDLGGTTYPWASPRVILLIVFGCLMAVLFVLSERYVAQYPLVPLELFKHKTTNACLVIGFIQDFILIADQFYLPLYFQAVKGASPVRSGLLILPFLLAASASGFLTGIAMHRTGKYVVLIRTGQCVMTLGCGLLLDLSETSSIASIVVFEIILGLGNGLLFQSPLIALQAAVSPESQSTATSSLGFARYLAMGLSVVLGGAVFQNSMTNRAGEMRAAGITNTLVDALTTGSGAAANIHLLKTVANPAQRGVLLRAFAWSIRNMFAMYFGVSACGLVAALLVVHHALSNEHVEVRTGLKQE